MTLDISTALNDWEFDPEEVTVRTIDGEDGREKIQLRLDLGIMQMEVDGRPDGQEVDGHPTWFDLHVARQQKHDAANPDGAPYLLAEEDCAELLREGVQFYHRYVSFWALKRYELCARDTERNLQLILFVREHAQSDRHRMQFDQWRPYVVMMHARSVATPLLDAGDSEAALAVIETGIQRIESFLADYGREDQAGNVNELVFLKRWRREVAGARRKGLPSPDDIAGAEDDNGDDDPLEQIRQRLEEAIAQEHYEEAAELRDELRRLENPPPPAT